jgi:hypothetical protein
MHDVTAPDPKLLVYLKVSVEALVDHGGDIIIFCILLKLNPSLCVQTYFGNVILLFRRVATPFQFQDIGVLKENFYRFE